MRVKRGTASRRRHKSMMKLAKGFRGRRKNCFKLAKLSVQHGLRYAYRDRKAKKADFRGLWIARINAASRLVGVSYSQLIYGLKQSDIEIDRKVLAEIAVRDPAGFAVIAEKAKAHVVAAA